MFAQSNPAQISEVVERNGQWWKPLPGATSTIDELIWAQSRWFEITDETDWNPWRTEEFTSELEQTRTVIGEWTRAEPDYQPMTNRRVRAIMGGITRKVRLDRARDEARFEQDKNRYNPDVEVARYTLLEEQARLARQRHDLGDFESGKRYPGMAPAERTIAVSELWEAIEKSEAVCARIRQTIGDPEDVVDRQGQLPRDRRPSNLLWYGIRRRNEVIRLQEKLPEARAALKAELDKTKRTLLSVQLAMGERQLEHLLAVAKLRPDDMCADCGTPLNQHGFGDVTKMNPCPAWPEWAARMAKVRQILLTATSRPAPVVKAAKPEPIATLSGGLPISEVIQRLGEIQAEHPEAIVNRGRANRWEIWSGNSDDPTALSFAPNASRETMRRGAKGATQS